MTIAPKSREAPFAWDEARNLVAKNELQVFARSKRQMDQYKTFKDELNSNNYSVFKHLLVKELKWYDPALNNGISEKNLDVLNDAEIKFRAASDKLFTNSSDIKVLPNHFPYNFGPDVTHLCVWSKLFIESDPNSVLGDLKPSTRNIISNYVTKTFVETLDLPPNNVVWFRNWGALQSVKGISHIHVLLKDAPKEKVEEVLYGPGRTLSEEEYQSVL